MMQLPPSPFSRTALFAIAASIILLALFGCASSKLARIPDGIPPSAGDFAKAGANASGADSRHGAGEQNARVRPPGTVNPGRHAAGTNNSSAIRPPLLRANNSSRSYKHTLVANQTNRSHAQIVPAPIPAPSPSPSSYSPPQASPPSVPAAAGAGIDIHAAKYSGRRCVRMNGELLDFELLMRDGEHMRLISFGLNGNIGTVILVLGDKMYSYNGDPPAGGTVSNYKESGASPPADAFLVLVGEDDCSPYAVSDSDLALPAIEYN